MSEIESESDLRKIINHIRTTLLSCDEDCEECPQASKDACILDMKTAIYDICNMIEQLFTLLGIAVQNGEVALPQKSIKEEKPNGMFA